MTPDTVNMPSTARIRARVEIIPKGQAGISDGNNIRIPTTNHAMEDDIAGSLLELVEILIPMLKARSSSFVSKYLPRPLAPGAYVSEFGRGSSRVAKAGHPT